MLDERVHGAVVHAHNLVLNGLIEWGWPLTLLLVVWIALGVCLFIRYGANTAAAFPAGIFLTSLLHAMLEYPWWYAYLLLPTAFSLGWMWTLSYDEYIRGKNSESVSNETVHINAGLFRQKLRLALPAIFLFCFGFLYLQQYLPLRFLFAGGYVKPMKVEELRNISSQAALFSMPLSYAIVMKLTENTTAKDAAVMIPYLKLAGRGTSDPEFLSRFAVVAALAQEDVMAQHLAWRAMQSDTKQKQKLINIVEKMNAPELATFSLYLNHPKMVNLDRSVFLK